MASITYSWAFLVTQKVKNLPAMWETWVCPWVRKIPWRKGQYSYLENPPWTEEPGRLQYMGSRRVRHN